MAKTRAAKPRRTPKPPAEAARTGVVISVASHPRAVYSITRAKGMGGLAGLLLVAWTSWHAGLAADDVAVRALLGGVAAYIACWLVALQVWRHLIVAETKAFAARRDEDGD
jgi:hypothetical protein